MSKLVGGRPIYFVGIIAHWFIYAAMLLALVPYPYQPATWVLCLCVAGIAAWFWPVLDYLLTAGLALVSVLCAVCLVSAVLAAVWLSCRIAERMEETE